MADQNRVTVVESIVHQTSEGHATPIGSRYHRFLASGEQGYLRLLVVGEEWQPLDTGWVNDASFLHVKNERPRFIVNPTPDHLAEVESHILELRMADGELPFTEVRVGESIRVNPTHIKDVLIRCRTGQAKCTINVLPE